MPNIIISILIAYITKIKYFRLEIHILFHINLEIIEF